MSIRCDVVVMGTGAAGLMAARSAAQAGADVWVISKMPHRAPNCTTAAYGDITWSTDETAGELAEQVIETGGCLSNQKLVEAFAEDIPARLADLRAMGVEFDEPRVLADGMPGAVRWSYRGKDSGLAMTDLMQTHAEQAGAKFMWEKVATRALVANGRVAGLAFLCLKTGELSVLEAPAIIVATGGGACMYRRTDNPPGATGDGIAMAYEAGAELVDIECVSFGFPQGRVDDALHAPEAPCEDLLEIGHAHYFLGGIRIDEQGASSIPGLFAAGESTGGVFGAARLGGSAVGECLVFGHRAGVAAAQYAAQATLTTDPDTARAEEDLATLMAGDADPYELADRLRAITWRYMGTVKTSDTLGQALSELAALDEDLPHMGAAGGQQLRTAVEVRSMRTLAELVARASLIREETRGCYWRTDFPEPDSATQLRNTIVRKEEGGPALSTEPPVMTRITSPREVRIGAGCFNYIERDA